LVAGAHYRGVHDTPADISLYPSAYDGLRNAATWYELAAEVGVEHVALLGAARDSNNAYSNEPLFATLPSLALAVKVFKDQYIDADDRDEVFFVYGLPMLPPPPEEVRFPMLRGVLHTFWLDSLAVVLNTPHRYVIH
jgi:hypothetical protein